MCSLEQFKIDLKNQKDEVRTLDFDLNHLLRRGSSMNLLCWLYPSSMCMHLASATLR